MFTKRGRFGVSLLTVVVALAGVILAAWAGVAGGEKADAAENACIRLTNRISVPLVSGGADTTDPTLATSVSYTLGFEGTVRLYCPKQTVTPTQTPPSSTATQVSASSTPLPTATVTATGTVGSQTPTAPIATATMTSVPTATSTSPSATATGVVTVVPTQTAVPSATPSPTPTQPPTSTPIPTQMPTPSPTSAPTSTPIPTPSPTPTPPPPPTPTQPPFICTSTGETSFRANALGFTLTINHDIWCPDDLVVFTFQPDDPVTAATIYIDMDRTVYPSSTSGMSSVSMSFNGSAWVMSFTARASAPCEQNFACMPNTFAPDSTIDDLFIRIVATRSSNIPWSISAR